MQKFRSRNVKTLPVEFSEFLTTSHYKSQESLNEKANSKLVDHLGEDILDGVSPTNKCNFTKSALEDLSTDSSNDSTALEINKQGGFSSTSSLSWSDEYEAEVTKKVQKQLETLDGIFRGLEEIPSCYDKEEINEWMTYFPNLIILGTKTPKNSPCHSNTNSDSEEVNTEDVELSSFKSNATLPKTECDINDLERTHRKYSHLKIAVVDQNQNKLSGRLLQRHPVGKKRQEIDENKARNKSMYTFSQKPRSLDIDKYLKISPLKSPKHKTQDFCIEFPSECTPLPYLNNTENSKKNIMQNRKNRNYEMTRRKKTDVILPPIMSNQFRSISATPRQSNKAFSALSMKYDKELKGIKSSRPLVRFLDINPFSSR